MPAARSPPVHPSKTSRHCASPFRSGDGLKGKYNPWMEADVVLNQCRPQAAREFLPHLSQHVISAKTEIQETTCSDYTVLPRVAHSWIYFVSRCALVGSGAGMTLCKVFGIWTKPSQWYDSPQGILLAPVLKSPGCASGIHRAFSERRSRHDLSILALTVKRRSVRDVDILGRDGSVCFDFIGVFCFSFDPKR